ncbi:MAG: molybdenum ABC transporter ATP-binding protein [Nitrospina sp.]|nr:molybdenum ABC transporter ATP-binding protein [Nitrospina sp.]
MNRLEARLDVRYPGFRLNVDLSLALDGVTVLFGPSGCGKTTFLRCIAGLETPPEGHVRVGGETWQDGSRCLPTHKRSIGFVFQDARLFPHKTVHDNLLYGYRRIPGTERKIQPDTVTGLLGLGTLLNRRPLSLSAGEKQRVAIGRALLTSPRLLLMDEPLANLDAQRKQEILPYLSRMRAELDCPILYVSHSMDEVLQLVDTLVLMEKGQVRAVGPAAEVLTRIQPDKALPASLAGSLLETRVTGHEREYGLSLLSCNGQPLHVPHQDLAAGSRLRLHVLAQDVSLVTGPREMQTSVLNILAGKITAIEPAGEGGYSVNVLIDVGQPLLATITKKSLANLKLQPGQEVFAYIKALKMIHN